MKLLGVRPRRAVDSENVRLRRPGLAWRGWLSEDRDHEHPIRRRSLARIDNDGAADLGVATASFQEPSGPGRGPIEIGTWRVQFESVFSRSTGGYRHRIAWI